MNENKTELIVISADIKQDLISHLHFNPAETEYTGSIKSARHLFGEKNLVLSS